MGYSKDAVEEYFGTQLSAVDLPEVGVHAVRALAQNRLLVFLTKIRADYFLRSLFKLEGWETVLGAGMYLECMKMLLK